MRISDWSSDVCSSDLAERDLGDHVGELHLNKLRRRQRATELLPLQRVGTGGMVAGLGRAHRAPGDAVAGAVEAAERTLQPLHLGKELLLGHLDRSAEQTSALQSIMRNSYAGSCLKKK